jgi:uncharacterized protein (TIRG00374 family)
MSVKKAWHDRINAYRNPVYIAYVLAGASLFLLAALIASSGTGPLEVSLFRLFNNLPGWLSWLMVLFSIPGTIGFAYAVAFIALLRRHYVNALKIILAGGGAYIIALILKHMDIRARPYVFLDKVIVRESTTGAYGFPSGHVAVATALAIVLYPYIPKRFHRLITWTVVMVAVSRLYLGVHLPMDLAGGYAIGLVIGSAVNYIFGSLNVISVSGHAVLKKMKTLGMPVAAVKVANVDARGSKPFFAVLTNEKRYFVKVVDRENNTADWLFKLWRRVIYRRLEDETPFFTPKRQLEHEAYVAGIAYANGITTPRIISVFEVARNKWAQAQTAINGSSLDKVEPGKVTDKVLDGVWDEIQNLHAANIAHRDLRAANVFLQKNGKPWLIDFGFSEASAPAEAMVRDNVELLASLSLLVGAERSLAAAQRAVGIKGLKEIAPYLSYSILSSATTKELKKRRGLMNELKSSISRLIHQDKIELKQIKRFETRNIFIIIVLLLALYVFVPRLGTFKDSFVAIRSARYNLLALGALCSAITYVLASEIYRLISVYPLRFGRTLLVQIGGSFANRLVPAGAGALATSTRYLLKEGHDRIQAASIAVLGNLIGFLGYATVFLLVVVLSKTPLDKVVNVSLPPKLALLISLFLILAIACVVFISKLRAWVVATLKQVLANFKLLLQRPTKMAVAVVASAGSTTFYALTLHASAHAVGLHFTLLQTFFVFTVGAAAAAVTPTPGGIGGAEAGLTAAMVAVGAPNDQALAAALIYRFLTYWLPILPGFICFQIALKKKYI